MIGVEHMNRMVVPPIDEARALDQVLDAHLRNLLIDLRELVPYDVAAAWLGHDDRPSLRVVLPPDASLPSFETTRHLIFQATAEAARIADLDVLGVGNETGLRCWLGVPLVLGERRRGWVELLSLQPNRFSDHDLQRASTLVRYAAQNLTLVERQVTDRHQYEIQQRLIEGVQRAFLAPSIASSLTELLRHMVEGSHAHAATLVMPVDAAYALGLYQDRPPPIHADQSDAHELVVVAARWPVHAESAIEHISPAALISGSGVVLPLTNGEDTMGWVSLRYASDQPLAVADPEALKSVTGVLAAALVWLREQTQREQHAQQSVRMLVQQTQQFRTGATTDLLAGLAHELHNPVSAITGMAGLLARDPAMSDEARADVQAMASEAARIGVIVQRLGHFAEPSATTKVPLLFNEVIADVMAVMAGVATQRGISLASSVAAESPVVLGNRAQLQQVLLDLLSNALEAVQTSDEPSVRVESECDGGWLNVRVSDNGYGIPEDLRERIFTPGFTTKTTGGTRRGLGIGLPLALDIVRNHWGTIAVSSQIWQGSCFTLRLPLV